ncbi:2,3-bisphosphoglycerate-independent phosphoglycerate mutase [Patescibacteria group bacterium]
MPIAAAPTTFQATRQIPQYQLVVLMVLDGYGVAPPSRGNAIASSDMPYYRELIREYPYANLQAAGEAVGLPWGEMGNSEVGHMNIGMGRIMYQELPRINNGIRDGSFYKNEVLLKAINHVKQHKSKLHMVGLLSNGIVHSSDEHLYQLLALAKSQGIDQAYVHAIMDGRDTPPKSGVEFVNRFHQQAKKLGIGVLASCAGRFYSMDRDNRWERIEKGYQAMTGLAPKTDDVIQHLTRQYEKGNSDENIDPVVLINEVGGPIGAVGKDDAVIYFNFRSDRARQLTKAFVLPGFEKFERGPQIENLMFVAMVEYEAGLPVEIAFPPDVPENALSKVISDSGLYQVHIAETEKFAHVTNFFDGSLGQAYPNEDFVLIPSPSVDDYSEAPEMSAPEITRKAVERLSSGKYNFYVINFANADMVGHTGNMEATREALQYLDQSIKEIVTTTLSVNGVCVITADHGNAEDMFDPESGEASKEHTANPVPFVLISNDVRQPDSPKTMNIESQTPIGLLSDVAPTILELYRIQLPPVMTGRSLLPQLIGNYTYV